MGKRFVPITRRVNIILIVVLLIGIGGISVYYAGRLFTTISAATDTTLDTNADVIYESIEALMINGEADVAESYFRNLRDTGQGHEVVLYRRDGVRAFQDNETIEAVNQRTGTQLFTPRAAPVDQPMTRTDDLFMQASSVPAFPQQFQEIVDERYFVHRYEPLINTPRCVRCHGTDHTVRGVLDIRTEITGEIVRRNTTVITAGSLFLGIVVIISIVLSQFLRRAVIAPVKRVGAVCAGVTGGDFSQRVTVSANNEIGRLGETVNTMVEGLHERFQLAKYVSSTTLASLREDPTGRTEAVTLLFSDIRGFTAYSERTPARVVVTSLNRLLNVQTKIIIECGGDVDKYVGDEIVAIFASERGSDQACMAAIRIQEELRTGDYGGLRVGIGINRGDVILGMIGSEQRADFTVIGDNVNTASRLCDAAGPGEIIISESVRESIAGEVSLDGPYRVRVKGKADSQRVHKLAGLVTECEPADDLSGGTADAAEPPGGTA